MSFWPSRDALIALITLIPSIPLIHKILLSPKILSSSPRSLKGRCKLEFQISHHFLKVFYLLSLKYMGFDCGVLSFTSSTIPPLLYKFWSFWNCKVMLWNLFYDDDIKHFIVIYLCIWLSNENPYEIYDLYEGLMMP